MAVLRIKQVNTDTTVYEEVVEQAIPFTEESVNQEVARKQADMVRMQAEIDALNTKLADAKNLG
jgi:uncharacterized coiled-coil protein SlyX